MADRDHRRQGRGKHRRQKPLIPMEIKGLRSWCKGGTEKNLAEASRLQIPNAEV
jgi:hypothetical protein